MAAMAMAQMTPAVAAARSKWRHRGEQRPPFALAPAAGQESVWDYPRPPRIDVERRRVEVFDLAGLRLADSTDALRVLETASPPTFYLPPADVRADLLRPSTQGAFCEWKGTATHFNVGDAPNVAWAYLDPFPEFAAIAGWFAFYAGRLRGRVGGEWAQPQPGGYYGGWVTAEVVGPFKGEAGSAAWW